MSDPQTETQKLIAALRRSADECTFVSLCRVDRPDHPASWCRGCQADAAADALDAQAAEIATLRETVANVSDAIAEYCARNGDKDMPQDQAEAVRFIWREVSTLREELAEAKRLQEW